jgi:hypothetical protein
LFAILCPHCAHDKKFGNTEHSPVGGLLGTTSCKTKTNVLPYLTFFLYNIKLELRAKPYGITKVLLRTFLENLGTWRKVRKVGVVVLCDPH